MERLIVTASFVITTFLLLSFCTVHVSGYNLVARRRSEFGHEFVDDVVVARHRRNVNNNVMPLPANILSINIQSRTSFRYTEVRVDSVVSNEEMESTEARFVVQIPETAFISNFSMLINGTWLFSRVLEKEEAEKVYKDAQDKGESAGHVSASPTIPAPRGMENFVIAINVAAQSEVEFKLSYTELLERRLGVYRQRISIQPGQIVEQLTLNAQLYEPQGFDFFKFVPPGETQFLESSRSPDLSLTASDTIKTIQYTMSVAAQRSLNADTGSRGEFVIEYDVRRDASQSTGGVVLIDNGYFIHYLAPSDPALITLDKNVAFVIDVSGSMSGSKIEQTREAMKAILSQLRASDYFNILIFNGDVMAWQELPIPGSAKNIALAKKYVDGLNANGGTNIEAALKDAGNTLALLQNNFGERRGKMLVFLTDGMPSVGVTGTKEIREIVWGWNSELGIPIFSLGFGKGVNFDFLQALSWKNYGFARKIYEAGDAASQLETFFTEIEAVTVLNLTVIYDPLAVTVSTLTPTTFPQYFRGTEMIVAGELTSTAPETWSVHVKGLGKTEVVNYEIPVSTQNMYDVGVAPWSAGFAEKLRAYLKIKDLIKEMSITSDETRKNSLKQAAVDLSLKYNFVTPVTSMVITQDVSSRSGSHRLEADIAGGRNHLYKSFAGGAGHLKCVTPLLGFCFFISIMSFVTKA